MQMYEAAYEALREIGQPSHLKNVHSHIISKEYFVFGAQNPLSVLGVCLDRHSKGIQISKPAQPQLFYRHAPATYGLVEWLDSEKEKDLDLDEEIKAAAEQELDSSLFLEEELHRWLFKNLQQNALTALGFGKLRLYDPDRQESISGKYETGVVGQMDMLLATEHNDYVVLELKRSSSDVTVGQICRYFGYIKEELAKRDQNVHGLILAREVNDQLRYAVKATDPNIRYRELSFDIKLGEARR